MFIRPFTITQTVMLLLSILLLVYLRASIRQRTTSEHIATRWMMQAIGLGALNILLHLLAGVFEAPLFDALVYIRVFLAFLLWNAIARALYALPPLEIDVRQREAGLTTRVIAILATLELCYLSYRYWRLWQTGIMPARLHVLELQSVLLCAWILLLILRKLRLAERLPSMSTYQTLNRALRNPQSDEGRFYRWFLLAMLSLFVASAIFGSFANREVPICILVFGDLLVSSAFLNVQFAYLGYRLAPVGLELRMVGAGLTIFLALVSMLGWLITFAFLQQQAPGMLPSAILGPFLQLDFVVQPAYRQIATQLSNLLLPLLGFEVAGSLLFVYAYTLYYRRTLRTHLHQIIDGFTQVQQGNLAYRITDIAWQDEFSQIVTSFNGMSQSLDDSYQEIQSYQKHLQELVQQRTAELTTEIENRKNLEMQQGIQEERERIARETHDGLLQTLMAMRIRLNRGKQVSRLEATAIQSEMSELSAEITQSIQDLRDLVNELNTNLLQDGLVHTLEQGIERQKRSYSGTIHTNFNYSPGFLPLSQELNVMRIVQEAMSNAIRHSGANELSVCVLSDHASQVNQWIRVQVRDNGKGFDPDQLPATGWGLKNIRVRAKQLGATLQITSAPHQATIIDVAIPFGKVV